MKAGKRIGLLAAAVAAMSITACAVSADTTIHVATIWNEDEEGSMYMKQLSDQYAEENPGVTVEFEVFAQGDMEQQMAILASSNALPDVFIMQQNATVRDYSAAGRLANVGQLIQDLGMDCLDQNTIDGIAQLQGTDALYVMPTENNIEGFFYNKAIFEEYGLEVPTTVDEFLSICATLKENGVQPLVSAGSEKWPLSRLIGAYATQVAGPQILVDASLGNTTWSDPALLEGYNFLLTLGQEGYLGDGVTTVDTDTQNSMFLNGQAAMLYYGSWFTQNLNSDANTLGENVGFFAFPAVEGGKGTGNNYVVSYGVTWAFNAESFKDEEKQQWFKYVFSHYGDEAMSAAGAITPYKLSDESAEKPYYTELIIEAMAEGGETAVWPEYYVSQAIADVIYEQAQNLALAITTPEDAGAAIDEAVFMNS